MISDLRARQLACDWHGGQTSPLYALCSSGAIIDGVQKEITDCQDFDPQAIPGTNDAYDLHDLHVYVVANGPRGPVDGWSKLNW